MSIRDKSKSSHSYSSSITHNDRDGRDIISDKGGIVTGLNGPPKQPHEEAQEELEVYVDNIENQFHNVLNRHENDFLNAYKVNSYFTNFYQGHMLKVQKELLYLKNKANETAGKILNDDQITNLQNQIQRFKNEAVKLDVFLDNQKREVQKQKSRELNINEDRKFLKEQTMDAMRNNKLLQVALKKTQKQNQLIKNFLTRNKVKMHPRPEKEVLSPKMIINQTMAQFKEPFITQQEKVNMDIELEQPMLNPNNLMKFKAKQARYIPQDMLSQESQDFKIKEFVQDLFKRNYPRDKLELKIVKFFKLYDLSRDDKIQELQRKIEQVKKNNMRLKNNKASGFAEKSEVENLFLDCVEECKKEYTRKRGLSAHSRTQYANYNDNSFNTYSKALIEKIVMNKEVLVAVFEEIFGSGGFVGTAISNLEQQIKKKKYSLVSQGMDESTTFYSNVTTKDNYQNEELERYNMIMNAPIEQLINSTYSQTKIGFHRPEGVDPYMMNLQVNKPRASTAHNKYNSTTSNYRVNNQTAMTQGETSAFTHQEKTGIQANARAMTSHSQYRRTIVGQKKSRQLSVKQNQANEKSFSVKNGKLVLNQTFISQQVMKL